jgi:hypothetical protein
MTTFAGRLDRTIDADTVMSLECRKRLPRKPDALQYFDWAVRELLLPDVKAADGCQITLASGYNKLATEPTAEQSDRCATRREVFPVLSRIQNIGVEDGTNYSARQRREHRTPWVAGQEHAGRFCLHAVNDQ